MSQYNRSYKAEETMQVEDCLKEIADKYIYEHEYAMWIDRLFMETMRYVPYSRANKTDWLYLCLDCGKSTSAGLHCTSK